MKKLILMGMMVVGAVTMANEVSDKYDIKKNDLSVTKESKAESKECNSKKSIIPKRTNSILPEYIRSE